MRSTPRIVRFALLTLVGLSVGCAEIWYKRGATTADLDRERDACRAEAKSAGKSRAGELFEKCMADRGWYHSRGSAGRTATAKAPRKRPAPTAVAAATPQATQTPSPATPPAAPAQRAALVAPTPALPPVSAPAPTTLAAKPLEPASAVAPPSSPAALPEAASLSETSEEEYTEEFEDEVALEPPPPADPAKRQFWFKLGAGTGKLEKDQGECRSLLGLAPAATEPSRWGQSPEFDDCMRDKGWGGGSLR